MCGITGFYSNQPFSVDVLKSMTEAIVHRGPDSEGQWLNSNQTVGLGHRRLSIVDLSEAGHQPMQSRSGRYWLVFNGEIYNFLQIKKRLEAQGPITWRGTSDTEVLLQALETWGVQKTLDAADGMFALALWDEKESKLVLARDRLGEKPLYYGTSGASFLFGSELKAITKHPHFQANINRQALGLMMRYAYVPTPYCIYEGFYKLEPAHWLEVEYRPDGLKLQKHCYWDIRKLAFEGFQNPAKQSLPTSVEQIEQLLEASVAERMVADVPLGSFLSGGIDSSLIVALMQKQSTRPVQTFSIGFEFAEYDEAPYARAIARHLGTSHTDMYVSAREAMDVIPSLSAMYDEPFADSSQIPTYLVSKIARRNVTVSLSGDAGDEFFGGYNRYFVAAQLWRKLSILGGLGRKSLGTAIDMTPRTVWETLGDLVPSRLGTNRPAEKAQKLARLLRGSEQDAYLNFVSYWSNPWEIVPQESTEPRLHRLPSEFQKLSEEQQYMLLDMEHYLTDDILVKVDRAAMATSLETRVPFLDRDVIEAAFQLPLEHCVQNGSGKIVLKNILEKYVPRPLFERPKQGFGIPLEHWLRGDLRDWAEDLLEPARMKSEGYFNPEPIQAAWKRHLSGKANQQAPLWPVLMFQAWLRQ